MRKWHVFVFSLVLALCLLPCAGFSQAIDGNLVGTVKDVSGAVVPGANVTLQNNATGLKYTAKSDSAGLYRFHNVPVGTYTLAVKAGGFADSTVQGVQVELNATSTANVTMQIGTVETAVTVSEAAPLLDSSTAQLSSNFEARQAQDLPEAATGNGVLNLSLLSAGVASSGGVGAGTGPSVGGQRPRNNSFNVDGVDNNDKGVTGPNLYVPNDAVASLSVLQNQFSAEFGHSSGAQFNTLVKSGTNEIHGSIYDYLQNRNLNAVDALYARQGITSNPRYDNNRLGATVGGPILKNKLFYFGNFEYQPIGRASSPGSPVYSPTADGYSKLSSIPGVSATNLDILKKYLAPAATGSTTTPVSGVDIPIGILPISAPNFSNQYNYVVASDYSFSDRDQIRGRLVWNKVDLIDTAANLPAFFLSFPYTNYLGTIAHFHSFSPNVTNELRLGYHRNNFTLPAGDFQFPGLDLFPNIGINEDLNVNIGPDGNAPQFGITNTYQLVDNFTWVKGSHTLKFGFDGRKLIAPQSFTQRARGDYQYSNLNQYLLDLTPDVLGERSLGNVVYYGDQVALYWYVNDTWKVRPNVTLTLGLRHEYTTVPFGERTQKLNAIADVPGVLVFGEPKTQKANFAPRIGIAYTPGKSGNTSIRAGFGMAYDVLYDNIGVLSLPPEFGSTTIDVDLTSNAPNFLKNGGIPPTAQGGGAACTTPEDCRAATASYIPDQKLPQAIQWNFGAQHVFHRDYTLEVRYVGTRGVHLNTQDRLNRVTNVTPTQSLPTYLSQPTQAELDALPWTLTKLRALPSNKWRSVGFTGNVVSFEPRGNSIYHGLQAQLNRRFSRGLQAVAAYTWSHTIDDSTADFFTTLLSPRRPQDFQDLRAERSSSALDRRQRLSLSAIWDVPLFQHSPNWFLRKIVGNLTASGTYITESPEYAVVQSGLDSNLNGDSAGDRSIINLNGTQATGSDVKALKNTAGATVAYLALNPNAQYIKAGAGAYANAGRNTLPLRGINNFNISLSKKFAITERMKFEFRADFLNAFNHPQFIPGAVYDVASIGQTASRNYLIPGDKDFNNPENYFNSNARTIQLVAKFHF